MKSDFKIEKGIPLPLKRFSYPFPEMKIGESFHIECPKEKTNQMRTKILQAARNHAGKYTTRSDEKGFRCWRYA